MFFQIRKAAVLLVFLLLFLNGCARGAKEEAFGEELLPGREAEAQEEGSLPDLSLYGEGSEETAPEEDDAGNGAAEITVYVCGAVGKPGIVKLPEGARVYEALQSAGGLLEDADERVLNQAAVLSDGDQVTVLTREETAGQAVPEMFLKAALHGSVGNGPSKVNINTAGGEELMTLPGIGEQKASAILAYRERNGGFSKIEEIMQVSGIKTALFERIRDGITVG